ncbi:glycoside hydrolase family 3 N-terminal domain-containing protein [Oceanispirochaeta sp.]|jgi:beta-xylosidase|uniref:glycoside hydrolase family 3 N-terminal domain-containing protein n=1 Tax=Oceanispirochaeta sp. TaxID=2035350 RepID=UPI002605F101|nr:glycoside hydrolase family 3 N-terminal domain-containing protein [Oceanispirochaeta sp.]MDA3957243.1 glycoside hydrolase family 3 C-terminal domain-containing protein [Oceanispirochaeta sp.]
MTDQEKAGKLLAKMTLNEKIAQLHSVWMEIHEDGTAGFRSEKQKKGSGFDSPLDLMKDGIGQITRPLGTHLIDALAGVRGLNLIQKRLKEETRLGIPALPHEESLAGLMVKGGTLFPAGINNGAMWDEDLVKRIAKAIGDELYSVGSRQALAPVLDVSRDVRWGRTEESMGEDPYLVGCLGAAYVQGIQGPDRRILATLKHFAGHSFAEGGRNHAPVRIGEKELYDTFLIPFEMAVKLADAGSVMPAYHDLDGEPLHMSYRYLTQLLRRQWGFDGLIVADYEGVSLLHTDHRVARTLDEAAVLSLKAGLDVELPEGRCFSSGLKRSLEKGSLDISFMDEAVLRVLKEKYRLGLFDNPYTDEGLVLNNHEEHLKLALEGAAQSAVLLKNNGILPLKNPGQLALVGPLGDDRLCMFSGYSFPVHLIVSGKEMSEKENAGIKTIKDALEQKLPHKLIYARGCDVLTQRPTEAPVFPGDIAAEDKRQQKTYISFDESNIASAVEEASRADIIVAALGDLSGLFLTGTVGEGSDVTSLELPGVQQKLLEALLDTGKPVIVVLISGRPYHLGRGFERAAAVLEAWLPGETGAEAIAQILMGEKSPGGRLPVSIPQTAGAMPYFYNFKLKSAGTPIQPEFGAEYPFGFGLSYTSFSYSNLSVPKSTLSMDEDIVLSFTLSNTGQREGDEIVQLYIRDQYASLVRPVKELKAFKRVSLKPGQSAGITFTVPSDMLSFCLSDTRRVVEPGDFDFMIGSSSRDIHLQHVITLEGEPRVLLPDWKMTSQVEISS